MKNDSAYYHFFATLSAAFFDSICTDCTKFYLIIAAETACCDIETFGLGQRRNNREKIFPVTH